MFGLAFGSVVLNELINYKSYKELEDKAKEKRYYNIHVNTHWFEKYLLVDMSPDELKSYIRSMFNYNTTQGTTQGTYYAPMELENIPRDKMLKWTSYNLYYKSMWQLKKEQIEYAANILFKIEEKIKTIFKDIDNDSIYFLKFGNNKMEPTYRPKFVSSSLSIIKDVCYYTLGVFGFTVNKLSEFGFKYFHYKHNTSKKNVMFIHGFGFGIAPYMTYLLHLRKKYNVFVIILPNLSNMEYNNYNMHMHNPKSIFPDYDMWRNDIKKLIIRHNISSLDVIAHSFGTIIFSILLNDPWIFAKVDKKIFIEPVCFIIKSYKIFRYMNEPKEGDYGFTAKVFNELIYKDIYLRYVTQRFMYGPEFWQLDYAKLKNSSLVILSEKDQVVPTDELYEKLSGNSIKCVYVNEAAHADLFMSDKYNGVFDLIDDTIGSV